MVSSWPCWGLLASSTGITIRWHSHSKFSLVDFHVVQHVAHMFSIVAPVDSMLEFRNTKWLWAGGPAILNISIGQMIPVTASQLWSVVSVKQQQRWTAIFLKW